ncbi:MAG: methionyl-tRNA formyltransferase [Rhodospirillales bacterium]|nr:methionyl-tRNA formyltransferase [Alphaproteobacteria bacterium]USO03906.1 MAG: methionyl-tRNA formyltransferase [Rhodospirillales bacterium]
MNRDSRSLRIAFMGTPDFAVPALQNLIDNPRYDVVCVYTQPPRPKGRGQQVQLSPVHECAQEHGIRVLTPRNFKHQTDIQAFKALNLDVAIVAAYGLILPKDILEAPRYGCLNIHASILPRWRGAAPIQRAILAGDTQTGVTIMQMDQGLDTGPMIRVRRVPIRAQTTAASLHDELSAIGSAMIEDVLDDLADKKGVDLTVQPNEGVTYAHRLEKEEGRVDWTCPAEEIDCRIRALNPWPGTWCLAAGGARLKILEAGLTDEKTDKKPGTILDGGLIACGEKTTLRLSTVQPENKKAMDAVSALNGGYLKVGDRLQ